MIIGQLYILEPIQDRHVWLYEPGATSSNLIYEPGTIVLYVKGINWEPAIWHTILIQGKGVIEVVGRHVKFVQQLTKTK